MPDWYEKAAEEIVEHLCPTDDEMLRRGRIVTAAKLMQDADPNRWIPVTERLPVATGERIQVRTPTTTFFLFDSQLAQILGGVEATHWRPVVLPEVKPCGD